MNRPNPITTLSALLLIAFMWLPLVLVVAFSVNASKYSTGWDGFTWEWYSSLLHNEQIARAVENSLILAFSSTLIATLLGTLLGCGMHRHQFRGKILIARLLQIPICIPDIVLAISLLLFYALLRTWTGWFQLGLATMVIAHVTFQIPFVALVIRARLDVLDPALEEAAADLGASNWQRFWHVTLPLLRPGIAAGALLAFTLSLDDFVVSFFTAGAGSTTVPILIYSSVKRGLTAEIHALSTLIILAAVLGTISVIFIQKRSKGSAVVTNDRHS